MDPRAQLIFLSRDVRQLTAAPDGREGDWVCENVDIGRTFPQDLKIILEEMKPARAAVWDAACVGYATRVRLWMTNLDNYRQPRERDGRVHPLGDLLRAMGSPQRPLPVKFSDWKPPWVNWAGDAEYQTHCTLVANPETHTLGFDELGLPKRGMLWNEETGIHEAPGPLERAAIMRYPLDPARAVLRKLEPNEFNFAMGNGMDGAAISVFFDALVAAREQEWACQPSREDRLEAPLEPAPSAPQESERGEADQPWAARMGPPSAELEEEWCQEEDFVGADAVGHAKEEAARARLQKAAAEHTAELPLPQPDPERLYRAAKLLVWQLHENKDGHLGADLSAGRNAILRGMKEGCLDPAQFKAGSYQ
jgi:hypothetical protein